MPQELLYHFGIHTRYKQDGSCTVPQIMKSHRWQTSIFQKLTKQIKDCIRPQKTAIFIREHNSSIIPLSMISGMHHRSTKQGFILLMAQTM